MVLIGDAVVAFLRVMIFLVRCDFVMVQQVAIALGFIRLLASKGLTSVQVVVTENVFASAVCVIAMCAGVIGVGLTNNYRVPPNFGLVLIGSMLHM